MADKETRLKLFKAMQKVTNETGAKVLISLAPNDPKEKREWANSMKRIQIAMWVDDGASCSQCKYKYESVDDFLARNPRCGNGFGKYGKIYLRDWFVCYACWEKYSD